MLFLYVMYLCVVSVARERVLRLVDIVDVGLEVCLVGFFPQKNLGKKESREDEEIKGQTTIFLVIFALALIPLPLITPQKAEDNGVISHLCVVNQLIPSNPFNPNPPQPAPTRTNTYSTNPRSN